MKIVQRDTQLIKCETTGDLTTEGKYNAVIGVNLDKSKTYTLMGFGVRYEYDADFENGSSIEFETRDYFVIDLENEKVTPAYLLELVKQSVDNSYAILFSECRKYNKKSPDRPTLNEMGTLLDLSLEVDQFYGTL